MTKRRLALIGLPLIALLGMGQTFGPQILNIVLAAGKSLTISNTLTLAGTDGTTITFPSTSASVPAYTAGDWTPNFVGSTTPGTGQTYSTQTGSYEQIGRQVTVRFNLTATSLGTADGNLNIAGLPVPVVNSTGQGGQCFVGFYTVLGLTALNYGVSGVIATNTSTILLQESSNTGSTAISVTQVGSTPTIQGFCSYRAS